MTLPHAPRARLATHEVTNQAEPLADLNLYANDAMLRGVAARAGAQEAHLASFGAIVGQERVRDLGRQANENPPKLTAFDRVGRRIDEVEFHPAYHELMRIGIEGGVAARAWTHPQGGHATHAALLMLMGWADGGVCCPMSMTYAAVPALSRADWAAQDWAPRVTAGVYDPAVRPAADKRGATMGMAMTEKQGGSDVRANTTKAAALSPGSDEVLLTGHKWFCSAPMSDAFLTLAYEAEGLSCFLAPRWRPDGTRNAIEIQRLKAKLGDASNASSEIEYREAYARRVGEPGRGVRTIIEMVNHTRLDCLAGSAGQIRMGVALAIAHCEGRAAFQRRLIDQPLMRAVLGDLALEAEAALALSFQVAALFDAMHAGDETAAARARTLTPIAKYWICKRAPHVAYEAMECHGGAGYVEESGLPRLFRQSPLNAIWEGSGNVIALDVLRALRDEAARAALLAQLEEAARLDPALAALAAQAERLAQAGETHARLFVETVALALQASALAWAGAPTAVLEAFMRLRVREPARHFGAAISADQASLMMERGRLTA